MDIYIARELIPAYFVGLVTGSLLTAVSAAVGYFYITHGDFADYLDPLFGKYRKLEEQKRQKRALGFRPSNRKDD